MAGRRLRGSAVVAVTAVIGAEHISLPLPENRSRKTEKMSSDFFFDIGTKEAQDKTREGRNAEEKEEKTSTNR